MSRRPMPLPDDLRWSRPSMTLPPLAADDPNPRGWRGELASFLLSCDSSNVGLKTRETYAESIVRLAHFGERFGIDEPSDMETSDLEQFLVELKKTPNAKAPEKMLSEATCDMHFRNLRVFYGWLAMRNKKVKLDNPFADLKRPKLHPKRTEILSDAELSKLLAVAKADENRFAGLRDTAILRVLLDGGVRVDELVGMRLDKVNLSNRTALVFGKGRKERLVTFSGKKTVEALDRYLYARHENSAADDADVVFLNSTRQPGPMSTNAVRLMLRRRGAQAGVTNVHPHRFRHTAYDAHKRRGMDDSTAKLQFGWESDKMPSYYAASTAEARAHERVREFGSGDRV